MNNKGFTLVELIATIALLAVIATISFVSINSIVNDNKVKNCKTLINNIKMAAKEYVSDNRYNTDTINDLVVGTNRLKVDFSLLVNEKYIKGEIIDPFTNESRSNSYIYTLVDINDDYTVKEIFVYNTRTFSQIDCEDKLF